MRVHLCGVRGSAPAVGVDFIRVGGNTSCVAIAHDDEEVPRLVLDAGTGLRAVSTLLDGEPFRGTILLGHLHWDHTYGLPFFRAERSTGCGDARLLLPEQGVPAIDCCVGSWVRPRSRSSPTASRRLEFRLDRRGRALDRGVRGARTRDSPQGWPHLRLPHHDRHDAASPTSRITARPERWAPVPRVWAVPRGRARAVRRGRPPDPRRAVHRRRTAGPCPLRALRRRLRRRARPALRCGVRRACSTTTLTAPTHEVDAIESSFARCRSDPTSSRHARV